MDVGDEVSANELLQAHGLIWNCSLNFIKPMSLKCAVELGIPDIINNHGQPITLSKLISSLPIHSSKAHCIYRLMRILVHSGFFATQKVDNKIDEGEEEEEEEAYSLTIASRLLLKDGPWRATPFFLVQLEPHLMTPWHFVSTWLQNSDPTPFEMVHGKTFWDGVGDEPRLKYLFTEAMATDSQLMVKVIVEECKQVFEGLTSLVDVGGGTGIVAKAIAKTFPNIMCTVLDLPYVVANSQGAKNLNFIAGDMFKEIPPANAILLKWILHDWSDEEAVMILKRCREAIWSKEKGEKVIIIDMVIENPKMDKKSAETQLYFDMLMMVNLTGRERNQKEWESLFVAAGFSHYKITPIVGLRSLMEVYP
ncbi:Tabersonine 16-O-methyltransferase [Morus notabilis]|uniref:Tabersonine 16-O-methyltransferase n=1 Tax=Morus notabilis TaxID=981085 RepID=W9R316_9ROSA|nr:trans-resveratrol di-O-methyltransferase [Morus notabilis]EXB54965.1 Tabersonine 16-O-methyltransferase [Morus notabilis]